MVRCFPVDLSRCDHNYRLFGNGFRGRPVIRLYGGDTFFSPTDGVIATALFLWIGFLLRLIRIKKEQAAKKANLNL